MSDYASSLPVRTEAAGDVDINISDAVTPSQKLVVNADGSINSVVTATQLDIDDLNATDDAVAAHLFDEAGDAFTSANPLPVEFFETTTELFDYDTASAIAKDATDDHEYTTTADFKLYTVLASGSGKLKAELQIETAAASGTFETVAVAFNSTANPNVEFKFSKGLNVADGAIIKVIRTNRDNQAQDLYSSIIGVNI